MGRRTRKAPAASSRTSAHTTVGAGAIAFDYGAKTVYVGSGIDEAEGEMIVRRIRERHAFADDAEKE